MKNIGKKKSREILIFSIIFIIVLGVLVYLFPYSGDDWAWGSSLGMERLQNLFRDYNGRYLGNIVVMILTRSNILRTVVITLTLYGLVYLGAKFTSDNKNIKIGLYLGAALLIFTPKEIWMQSVVWTAGYSNYVISMLLVLIYFIFIKKIFEDEKPTYSNKYIVMLFILGFATTLFVEHVTLYCVVLGIFVIIFTKIKFKKIYLVNVSYTIGTLVGTILMFSNGAYRQIVEGTETYRSIPDRGGFIIRALGSYFKVIYKQLAMNNTILNLVLSGIVVIVILKAINKNKEKRILGSGILFVIVIYPIYGLLTSMNSEWKMLLKYTMFFNGIFSILYYVALILAAIFFIENKVKKARLLFLLGSLTILVGPLFVVNPIGPRCFFGTYLLFILITIEFIGSLNLEGCKYGIKLIIVAPMTIQFIYMFSIYGYIYKINVERIDAIKVGIENRDETIIIPKLPYKKYVWTGDPFSIWTDRMKLFYKIPEEVELKAVDLKEWEKINKKAE